ncbi:MAG: PIG-L family deacetylase [Clostridiales bacterium]|jgi:LmbE family N-acetylglucosaminyl deacetylase|nr:PIG-L family deacetylase [Clostridiales bacterium]
MKLNERAEVYYPQGPVEQLDALCFAAHQDDIEFMAYGGIFDCYKNGKKFGGVVTTDGAGSPRDGKFARYTDDEMKAVRREEQLAASRIGGYGVQILLNYPSAAVKSFADKRPTADFAEALKAYRPAVVYTHNLADKHDTHVGVAVKAIEAIRTLKKPDRPKKLIGCEVWRGLDWICDDEKLIMDVTGGRELGLELMGVFESQIAGGKRYDRATDGRRFANATYLASHGVDTAEQVAYGMDLTPLIEDDALDILGYIKGFIDRFWGEVEKRLGRVL